MSVMVIVELPAQPERADEVKSFIRSVISDTRVYEGCQSVSMLENADDPSEVILVEQWGSRAQHEKYVAWRTETGDFPKVIDMLAGPPSIKYFDDLNL